MMKVIFEYLFWSGLGIVLLYLLDQVLFSKRAELRLQRSYFIIGVAVSILLPVIAMLLPQLQATQIPTITLTLNEMTLAPEEAETVHAPSVVIFPWHTAFSIIWAIGTGTILLRLLLGRLFIAFLMKMQKRGKYIVYLSISWIARLLLLRTVRRL